VGAQNVSKQEVPHEKALMWVSYFSHLAEPSNVTVIDGTLLEQDELDVLAREEEGTSDARAITAASKRTLVYGILETFLTTFSKSPGETTWHLGKRQYDLDQIKEFYEGKMKDREMYVIPYYNTWSDSYGIRISDSA
jgi:GTP-dependent phosphoenolpyruvate carboxykinase